MSVGVNTASYADFKAIVAGFQEQGTVIGGQYNIAAGCFYLQFLSRDFDFSVNYGTAAGVGAPSTLATDFPDAVICTSITGFGYTSTTTSSYADFKAIVAAFQEKGQVVFGPEPGGGGNYSIGFVTHKFDFVVICSAAGTEPSTLISDFPTAIICATWPVTFGVVNGVAIAVNSYADFKTVVSGFQEKGQIVFGPYTGGFSISFVSHNFKLLITSSPSGSAPSTLAADFPTTIMGSDSITAAGF